MSLIENYITLEIRKLNKKARWLEWSTSKEVVKANLKPNEHMVHLPYYNVYVAYEVIK